MNSSPNKIVILYSGGLDSYILYHYAKKNYPDADVVCIYYKHGADSEKAELNSLPDFVTIRHIDWLNDEIRPRGLEGQPLFPPILIPGRNMVFATLACSQEIPDEIWLGALYDDDNERATDKNEFFRSNFEDLISYVLSPFLKGKKIKFRYPFVEQKMCKPEILEWALNNGVTKKELKSTTSCHFNDGVPCGECLQCLRRMMVFEMLGIHEEYKVHPMKSPIQRKRIKDFIEKYRSGTTKGIEEDNPAKLALRYRDFVGKENFPVDVE